MKGINPGQIGMRVGLCMDKWQDSIAEGDIYGAIRASRALQTLAAPYLRRPEGQQLNEELNALHMPAENPRNVMQAWEVMHQRVEVILSLFNVFGLYGYREAEYGDLDDLPTELIE